MNGGMYSSPPKDSPVRVFVRKLSMFRAVRSGDAESVNEKSPLLLDERQPVDKYGFVMRA